jgi:hypothetical protein
LENCGGVILRCDVVKRFWAALQESVKAKSCIKSFFAAESKYSLFLNPWLQPRLVSLAVCWLLLGAGCRSRSSSFVIKEIRSH